MRINFILFILLTLVISACSTRRGILPPPQPIKPPPSNIVLSPDGEFPEGLIDDIRAQEWSMLYKQAMAEPTNEDSCVHFTILSQTPEFPLHWGALWRLLEHCKTPSEDELNSIVTRLEDLPDYWEKPFLNSLIRHYQLLDMKEEWISTLLKLSSLSKLKIEKENYLLTALNLANDDDKNDMLEKLQKLSPRFMPEPKIGQLLLVARDFEDAMEFEDARRLYRQIIKEDDLDFDEKLEAWDRLALTEKKAQGKEEFAKVLEEKNRWLKHILQNQDSEESQITKLDSLIEEARAWWTVDQNQKARNLLKPLANIDDLENSSKKIKNIIANAVWVLAMISVEEKKHKQAREFFDLTHSLFFAEDSKNFDPLMSMSKYYFQQKKYEEAAMMFSKAYLASAEDYQREMATFWQGMSFMEAGQPQKAPPILLPLAQEDRWGLYGHLARNLLKTMEGQKNPTNELVNDTEHIFPWNRGALEQKPQDEEVDSMLAWLGHLEEDELAELYLDANWKSPMDALLKCTTAGLHHRTLHYYFKLPEKVRLKLIQDNPGIAYPFPWRNLIEEESKKHQVPVALVLAIIRQESHFKPKARSPADAFGLMQLIPETARKIARKDKRPFKSPEELFLPEVNIPLGVSYLGELLKSFNGSMPLAIASYNAGRAAVQKWLKTRADVVPNKSILPQLIFSENIPYKETKNYVSKVMRNYVNYCMLIEKRDCSIDLAQQFGKKL